jgi:hypothetical protein
MALTDAHKLVEETLRTYRGLTTYQDDGTVSIQTTDQPPVQRATFETRFLRPSYFRFKFAIPHPHPPLSHVVTNCVCGFDGKQAYLWMKHHEDRPKVQKYKSITMAVAGATGISSGSAHTIAQLLLKGFNDKELLSLKNAKLGDKQVMEGKTCRAISGKLPRAKINVALLVDVDTMLLQQLTTDFEDFSSIEIRRNIRVNESLEKRLFACPNGEI